MESIKLIESFYQGSRGNCVSIACIKAAIAKWGVESVFTSYVEGAHGGFSFTMRDGFSSQVRPKELSKARSKSGFLIGDDDLIFDWAQKYFAAMAKRVLVEGEIDVFFSLGGFNSAIKSLNNGEGYYEGIKWLGLKNNQEKLKKLPGNGGPPTVAASNPHCFFAWSGYFDRYGDAVPIEEIKNDEEAFQSRFYIGVV